MKLNSAFWTKVARNPLIPYMSLSLPFCTLAWITLLGKGGKGHLEKQRLGGTAVVA